MKPFSNAYFFPGPPCTKSQSRSVGDLCPATYPDHVCDLGPDSDQVKPCPVMGQLAVQVVGQVDGPGLVALPRPPTVAAARRALVSR